jgi:hypothetical protein
MDAVAINLARSEWAEGSRRFDEAVKTDRRLLDASDAVIDELRRRVGQTFTLEELAAAYATAEQWAYSAVADHVPFPGWPRRLTDVLDATFHHYARGATDYAP